MCSKFDAFLNFEMITDGDSRNLQIVEGRPEVENLSGTIYPHRPGPVVVMKSHQLVFKPMNFSLIPSWSKEAKPEFATYNARIETVLQKPTWEIPFRKQHCAVPIRRFYESVREGEFADHTIGISAEKDQPLWAAGIWDSWLDKKSGQVIESFAILTKEPPSQILKAGHDRCPIFIKPDAIADWVNPELKVNWMSFLRESLKPHRFHIEAVAALKPLKN